MNTKESVRAEDTPSEDASGDAASRLRKAIVGGRFLPNQRLTEFELAAFLGASRGSARAALTRLEYEGLIVREPNRGARVRLVSETEAIEIVEIRAALEALVARHAALAITPERVERLRILLRNCEGAFARNDLMGYIEENARLHRAIIEIANHRTASAMLHQLHSQTVSLRYRSIMRPGRVEASVEEHRRVVEAIVAGDPAAAERAMHLHLSNAVAALREKLDEEG